MGQLVLTLKAGERVKIGDSWVQVARIGLQGVRIGFEFPRNVEITREKYLDDDSRATRKPREEIED